MENPIQKLKQNSVFEKPGILSDNLKTLTSSSYPTVQYFLLKLCTHLLLTNVYKRVCGIFFYFIQILHYLQKLKKTWFLHSHFLHSINKSISKQNKKILHIFLQTLLSRKHVQNPTILQKDFSKCYIYCILYQEMNNLRVGELRCYILNQKDPGSNPTIRT